MVETSGDADYFTVELEAGHTYSFGAYSQSHVILGHLPEVTLSISGNALHDGEQSLTGPGGANFTFNAAYSGTYYVRVSGQNGGVGAYGVSVSAGVAEPPTPPPPDPTSSAFEDFKLFWDGAWGNGIRATVAAVVANDEFWPSLKHYLTRLELPDRLEAANYIVRNMSVVASVLDFSLHLEKIRSVRLAGGDVAEATYIEFGLFITGFAISSLEQAARLGAPLLVSFAGPVGAALAAAGGSGALSLVYDVWLQDIVKGWLDEAYDGVSDYSVVASGLDPNLTYIERTAAYFDEEYYLATYRDVSAAIHDGLVGSAHAHYLTTGIDLGYRPNADVLLTRADLAVHLIDSNPNVFGNSVLFARALKSLEGDGLALGEIAVADAIGEHGAVAGAALDARLSALAHRKALDLAVNSLEDAVGLASGAASDWAQAWSNGAAFDQLFAADLADVLGEGFTSDDWRLFVVSSASGAPADILAALESQAGWADRSFDTFGIAEVGGLWVVIAADRGDGYEVEAPEDDLLAEISQYGSEVSETLLAGLRTGAPVRVRRRRYVARGRGS